MKNNRCCEVPFTNNELAEMVSQISEMPDGVSKQHFLPVAIRHTLPLDKATKYQVALLCYGHLLTLGVTLQEFEGVCEHPKTWENNTVLKEVGDKKESDVISLYYMNCYTLDKGSMDNYLMTFQTIRLVFLTLKMFKIEVEEFIILIEKIMQSSRTEDE